MQSLLPGLSEGPDLGPEGLTRDGGQRINDTTVTEGVCSRKNKKIKKPELNYGQERRLQSLHA